MLHDALLFGFYIMTTITIVGLAICGLVVPAYLLFTPVRKRLDRWMLHREADIWAETLSFVDAEKAKYQRAHGNGTLRRMDGAAKREPSFKSELYGQSVEDEYVEDVLPF